MNETILKQHVTASFSLLVVFTTDTCTDLVKTSTTTPFGGILIEDTVSTKIAVSTIIIVWSFYAEYSIYAFVVRRELNLTQKDLAWGGSASLISGENECSCFFTKHVFPRRF